MAKQKDNSIKIKNRKAEYEYFLLSTYCAGIVLLGTEIKSIRLGKVNLNDAYCAFKMAGGFIIYILANIPTAVPILRTETSSNCCQ